MSEETGSAEAGNPAPEAPAAVAAAPAAANWVEGIQDTELRGFAEAKGFHNATPADALKSYMHLEKLFGADRVGNTVKVLGDNSTPEEVNAFYSKLGRPDTPDKYAFEAPEGADPGFATAAKEQFHALGLTNEQAVKLTEWWNGQTAASVEAQGLQYQSSVDTDMAALRKEWGAAYDKKISEAKAAAGKFGLQAEQIDGMEKALGFGGLMKFMSNIGSKLGEDVLDSMESNTGSEVMTPAAAMQKLNELKADPKWMEAFFGGNSHPGHADAVAKKAQLSKMIAGGA